LTASGPAAPADEAPSSVHRYLLEIEEVPAAPPNGRKLAGRTFAITEDGRGVSAALSSMLEQAGATVRVMATGARLGKTDGLIDLSALLPDSGPQEVKKLFRFAKQAVRCGATTILAATGMGGDFGRNVNGPSRPGQGGAAGFLKSLSKEKPSVHIRAVDLDPNESPARLAGHIYDELVADDEHVEVGYREGKRRVLKIVRADFAEESNGGPDLTKDSVVLVTGGARGITAQLAVRLAARFDCALELVGRTPLGEDADEDPELAAATDTVALKRVLAARGVASTPAELEQIARRVAAEREIRQTLQAIRDAGGQVTYHAVDVRNARAFGKLIEGIYERYGRLDGVIHGAGVIEDKLLVDKTRESFDRVFDTKVKAALTLARKLRDGVRFVVFFSSVSSAFGNRGQTDYAAANDLLDKLAHQLNDKLDGRVLSVNWGPWDSRGMVSPELRREYERAGVGLIPLSIGPDCLLSELGADSEKHAQVILMNAEPAAMR
jgi:NAD(P)-dependent dehydrogenase (short-subunit alcohol dehydrogenase family)